MAETIKPSEIYKEGYNCAESVVIAYNKEFESDIPSRLCTALGGGCGVASLCGAINGSTLIIGHVKGRDDASGDKMISKRYVQDFMKTLHERYGTHMCKDLKANKVSCAEIMDISYELVKETLKKDL
ncbi:oxidoreductase [Peptacetobacter hominis]|uniref:Oxidoreductase n=1 Tax=Peptacetobacter hominis TaxID=2743610 RepID=A0A544QYZ3_9FIRM|nr:C-GCAxxG-C-C family (seleno)protein [Peptacetobacter hominis]TQQ85868.1 oxidoreductase [Peptacetobacter hominis]